MAYRHATKAGNRADAWKHFILSETLEALLSRSPDRKSPFRYFETHAGPGTYRLGENGEWRTGIATVARAGQALSDSPYIKALSVPPEPGDLYFGSWILAGRILLDHGRSPVLEICDTDPQIASAAQSPEISIAIRRNLTVHLSDGFKALAAAGRPDFVLIDPPYTPDPKRDWQQSLSAAKRLEAEDAAGLIWYPLFRSDPLSTGGADLIGYEIEWGSQGDTGRMVGCGILGTGPARECLMRLTGRMRFLAEAFSARFRESRPESF